MKYFLGIETPAIGKIYSTDSPLEQFSDGCIYLVNRCDHSLDISAFEEAINGMSSIGSANGMIGRYDFYEIPKTFDIRIPAAMMQPIDEEGFDLILPLYMPSYATKQYLLCKSDDSDPVNLARLIINTSECLTLQSVRDVICDIAIADPEKFLCDFKDLFTTKAFLLELYQNLASSFDCAVGITPINPFGRFEQVIGSLKGGFQSFKDRLRLRKSVEDKLMKSNRERLRNHADSTKKDDVETGFKIEVHDVVSSIDHDLLMGYIDSLSPKMRQDFMNQTNPDFKARQSTMTIEIRNVLKLYDEKSAEERMRKNDGRIQLFLAKGKENTQHIHFDTKNAFIIYTMYLIDKKDRGDNVDSIDVTKKFDVYRQIYEIAYPGDIHRCKKNFMSLIGLKIDEESGLEVDREPALKKCYREIRMLVGDGCAALGEHAVCHTIADEYAHLYTRPDKITIPDRLKNIKVEP